MLNLGHSQDRRVRVLLGGTALIFALVGVAAPAMAAQVLGCCVTDDPCLPVADEQVACLISGGDFVTAASGALCVDFQNGPAGRTAGCTCAGLGDLSGRDLVSVLDRSGQCRQLPKGRVCTCPAPSLPTATPTRSPTRTAIPPPLPTFTAAVPQTPEPVGCCQFSGSPGTCRQTTVTDCKAPGRPAVFVQNANCTADGRCLIIPNPNETPSLRIRPRRLRHVRPPGLHRP
jgi:hypothetical protein